MDLKDTLEHLSAGRDLSRADSAAVLKQLMTGEATEAQCAAILTALHMKGETVEELTGAAQTMRELATTVPVTATALLDTCGTGGSGSAKLFNVSTAAAFVAAAAGATVAKHGNRRATSRSGSADLLEVAGARIDLTPQQVGRCVDEVGVGFLFAQAHHSAMRHVIGVRQQLGFRTLFNLLGPMTNPAGARLHLLGVFDPRWQRPVAETLGQLGSERALVVHSNGLDEIALDGETRIVELRNGSISEYALDAQACGITPASHAGLAAESPERSLELVEQSLDDPDSPAGRLVALNSGAAIYVAGLARDIPDGVTMAQDAQAAGLARERFSEFVRITQMMAEASA